MSHPLVLLIHLPHQKSVVVGLRLITAQAYQEILSVDHQKGGSEFVTFPETNTEHVSGE